MSKFNATEVFSSRSFVNWLICEAATGKQLEAIVDSSLPDTDINVRLVVNGIDLDATKALASMEKQYNEQVKQAALDLVASRCATLSSAFQGISENIETLIGNLDPDGGKVPWIVKDLREVFNKKKCQKI